MLVLGFDIGGTKCAVMLARAEKERITFYERREIATKGAWQKILERLLQEAEQLLIKWEVASEEYTIGISCGGPLDSKAGKILSPPNLPGWDNVPIIAYLEERLHRKAYLQNDADACALAEWRYGAGKGSQNMIFLTFGTGLGAGLILNGKLYTGASQMAGEVGHIRMTDQGPIGYGKAGSLEGYASGGGIRQLAQSYARELQNNGKRASYQHASIDAITTKDVAIKAQAGHKDALEVFAQSGYYLGKGLAILLDLLNPEVIVLGSIYVRARQFLQETMEEQLNREALEQNYADCRILPAQLGEQIGDYAAIVVGMGEGTN